MNKVTITELWSEYIFGWNIMNSLLSMIYFEDLKKMELQWCNQLARSTYKAVGQRWKGKEINSQSGKIWAWKVAQWFPRFEEGRDWEMVASGEGILIWDNKSDLSLIIIIVVELC